MWDYFLYFSRPTFKLTEDALQQMQADFGARNRRLALTGFLKVERAVFYQYVEGPYEACEGLRARLLSDRRHSALRFLLNGVTPERRFARWSMDFRDYPAIPKHKGIADKPQSKRVPLYLCNGEQILQELAEHAPRGSLLSIDAPMRTQVPQWQPMRFAAGGS